MDVQIPPPPPGGDAPAGPDSRTAAEHRRLRMAAFMVGAGAMHFVAPRFYERIVPRWAGNPRAHVIWSGLAELTAGALMAVPRTRRVGAWLALVTLVAVYPANVQMALDAGRPKDLQGLVVWARLPMQLPMWRAAYQVATDDG